MRRLRTLTILLLFCVGRYSYTQNIRTLSDSNFQRIKSENGLILTWQLLCSDFSASQINVFSEEGQPILSLNVLRLVPDALRVSIYDVSARPGREIAIAAVYRKAGKPYVLPVPTLLIFDFNGRLLSAFKLGNSHAVERLEIDDKSNIWTVTTYSGHKNPSTVPMVVEYTSEGMVAQELLTRDKFPFHAEAIRTGREIGSVFAGYGSGEMWFWLPGSTELVTISTGDGGSRIVKTQLPHSTGGASEHPLAIVRDGPDRIVAQFGEIEGNKPHRVSYYTWSDSGGWLSFDPGPCVGGLLIGAGERGLVYMQPQSAPARRTTLCVSQSR